VKPVLFHLEARKETRLAVAYYEEQRENLGREFRIELEAAVQRLRQTPQAYPDHDSQGTRKLVLRRFPFTLFVVELESSTWVAAVAHHKRRPGYWTGRRPDSHR
jgi:toxin ParE1/3/4